MKKCLPTLSCLLLLLALLAQLVLPLKAYAYPVAQTAQPTEADAHFAKGEELLQAMDSANALVEFTAARTLYEEAKDQAGLGRSHIAVGHAQTALKAYAEAQQALDAAVALAKANKDLPLQATALDEMGALLAAQEKYKEALGQYEAALNIWLQQEKQPQQVATLMGMGVTYRAQKSYDQALEAFGKR